MATSRRFQARNGLDNNSLTLIGVATPVNTTDAANKAYADTKLALTGGTLSGQLTIDVTGAALGIGTPSPVAALHIQTPVKSLSLASPASGGGGASYIMMGNNDSNGTAGPSMIVAANRVLQLGVGDSFSSPSGGNFNAYLTVDSSGLTSAGSLRLSNGFEIQQGASSYGQFSNWVHLPGYHGLYSGINSAHLYPNSGSYGAWRMDGSNNGWRGLNFQDSVVLMMNDNETGIHRNGHGWQHRWHLGTMYVYKNSQGGGTEAVVLDSTNYSTYSPSYGYLDDYTRGEYRVISDYQGMNTWYIRADGRFTWARAHDWTQSFDLNLSEGTAGNLDGWALFGQSTSNSTNGTWNGTRFVRYLNNSMVDGDVRANAYFLGDNTNRVTIGGGGSIRSVTSTGWVDIGSQNSSHAHIQTDRSSFYFNTDVFVNGQIYKYAGVAPYLHSENYNSYAPTLTGGGASGTWGINVTGNASTATTLQTARNINGTSFNGSANIETTEWVHSDRDFPNGTLVTTSIDYSVTAGDPWILEIKGNSYGSIVPFDIQYQGYIYYDTIISHGGYSNGTNITGLVVLNVGGNLCFWWPNQAYWQGYNVRVYTAYATRAVNKVVSITHTAKPSGTKEVALTANIRQSLHSGNYNSYAPTLTGGGASGTWGINVTGTAGSIINQANSATITASPSVIANYIVQRDGNGYIYANHVNFSTGIENPSISSFITDNGDGWSRKSSLDHVKNSIRSIADGTWSINVTGNASTATTLQTARTLWGQSFDGSANITGSLTSVGDITGTGAVVLSSNNAQLSLQAPGASGTVVVGANSNNAIFVNSAGKVGIGGANIAGNSLEVAGNFIAYTNSSPSGTIISGVSNSSSAVNSNCIFALYNDLGALNFSAIQYFCSANNAELRINNASGASYGLITFYQGSTRRASILNSGQFQVNSLSGTGNRVVYSDSSGTLTNTSSDATLKNNVQNIQYGLSSVLAMRPVSFNWIDEERFGSQTEIGFIAQEIQQIVPEVIGENSDQTLSLDYPKLIAVLTKAIQDQQAIIADITQRLTVLEGNT